jgi:hypothetical protein
LFMTMGWRQISNIEGVARCIFISRELNLVCIVIYSGKNLEWPITSRQQL